MFDSWGMNLCVDCFSTACSHLLIYVLLNCGRFEQPSYLSHNAVEVTKYKRYLAVISILPHTDWHVTKCPPEKGFNFCVFLAALAALYLPLSLSSVAATLEISTQTVTFETWDPSDIWLQCFIVFYFEWAKWGFKSVPTYMGDLELNQHHYVLNQNHS